jgi:hypothetical protein
MPNSCGARGRLQDPLGKALIVRRPDGSALSDPATVSFIPGPGTVRAGGYSLGQSPDRPPYEKVDILP